MEQFMIRELTIHINAHIRMEIIIVKILEKSIPIPLVKKEHN